MIKKNSYIIALYYFKRNEMTYTLCILLKCKLFFFIFLVLCTLYCFLSMFDVYALVT